MRPEEKQFIEIIKDHYQQQPITLVDVGANCGSYTKFFSRQVACKKIYLFEPIEELFQQLPGDGIHTKYNIGVGSKDTTLKFHRCIGKQAHSSFVMRSHYIRRNYDLEIKDINVRRLDSIIADQRLEVLKIDVEGFELEALKGCSRLLDSGSIDFIQFEYGGCFKDQGIKLNDVIEYLNQFNYLVYDLHDKEFVRVDNFLDNYQWKNFYAKQS